MTPASRILDNLIAADRAAAQRTRFEGAVQAKIEQDFLQRFAAFAGCDYQSAEAEFDRLGVNVSQCVNSPTGRAVLARVLTTPDSPVFLTTIN